MSKVSKKVYGLCAEFSSASTLYKAAEAVRDAGFSQWDCYTPYPVHGLDKAMGMKKSPLPRFVFVGGACGITTAFCLAYGTQVVMYPTVVQAKPVNIFTTAAFFPIMFELTILFSAITVLIGVLTLMKLPRWNHPVFASEMFSRRATDDGFLLVIEARDEKFELAATKQLLGSLGAKSLELIEDDNF